MDETGAVKEAQQKQAGDKKMGEPVSQMTETQKEMNGTQEFQSHVFTANFGLNISHIEDIDSAGYGFMLGGKYSFYFSPKVGVFVGLDYMQRNAEESLYEFKMTSIDIPFGLTFRYKTWIAPGATFLGLYYNLPQGGKAKYTGTEDVVFDKTSLDIEGENHLGFLLQTESYFEVNENFNLGFFFGLKFGFGDYISKVDKISDPNKNNTLDLMFGAVARF